MAGATKEPVLTGGCQCGAVRYALYTEPTSADICHCRMCQKAVGNLFMAVAGVPEDQLVWTKGAPVWPRCGGIPIPSCWPPRSRVPA
jgi:hypothetical protein